MWAIFGPAVGWSFIGTGLYAWRRRPESRIGALMILLGFAWFLFTLDAANSPLLYTLALWSGGLWGSVFLHIGVSFPTGRLTDRDGPQAGHRRLRRLPAGAACRRCCSPARTTLGCDDCPTNLLLVRRDADVAAVLTGLGALAYLVLFASCSRGRCGAGGGRRPSSACSSRRSTCSRCSPSRSSTVARAGAGDAALWPAFIATLLTPFAFLGGLLRTRLVTARRRAAREPGRAARLARADRAGRRRRAPAPGARPARRGAVAARRAQAPAEPGAAAGPRRRRGASRRCSPRRSTSSTRASPSCASWRAASTRRSSPTTASSRRCRRSRHGRRCR